MPRKTVFILRWEPGSFGKAVKSYFTASPSSFLTFMFCDDWLSNIFCTCSDIFLYDLWKICIGINHKNTTDEETIWWILCQLSIISALKDIVLDVNNARRSSLIGFYRISKSTRYGNTVSFSGHCGIWIQNRGFYSSHTKTQNTTAHESLSCFMGYSMVCERLTLPR